MAEYHVVIKPDGKVLAGPVNKNGKLTNSSDVTDEVLEAVKEHLLIMNKKYNRNIARRWDLNNGKSLFLMLDMKDTSELKEEGELPNE